MQIKLNSKKLLSALNLCNGAINQNGIIPATSCFQFTALGDTLNISACNGEVSMETSLECDGEMSLLIPADKIIKLLSSLPDHPITINASDDFETTVTYNGGIVSFSGYSGEGFLIIKTDKGNEAVIQSEDLQAAIYSTAYARSTEQTMPVFMGLDLTIEKDKISFAGCNKTLLSVYNITGKFKVAKILLPVAITNIIGAISIPGELKINYSKNSICFEYSGLTVRSLLMGDAYPDYMSIVPVNETKLSIDRSQLLSAIKRVIEFSNKVSKQVFITSENGELAIRGEDTSFKQKANERIKIPEKSGIEISVNGSYLVSALSHIASEFVEMSWQAKNMPILLNEPKNTDDFVMIMAMQ